MACAGAPRTAPPPEQRAAVADAAPPPVVVDAAPPRCACGTATDVTPLPLPSLETVDTPSRANLSAWVHALAAPELRGREAGTADARRAALLIATALEGFGTAPASEGDYCQPFSSGELRDQNVIAHVPPASGECPWLVIGAHYDALGTDAKGRMFPGADDNATGVAIVLELARLVRAGHVRSALGLSLVWFGAEEKDLAGSQSYVKNPSLPLKQVRRMINIDMAGRRPKGYPVIGYDATGRDAALTAHGVRAAAKRAKVDAVAMDLEDRGDSASFSPHVPALFLCTTVHADYHQPTDTPDRVDYEQVERALKLLIALVEGERCQ